MKSSSVFISIDDIVTFNFKRNAYEKPDTITLILAFGMTSDLEFILFDVVSNSILLYSFKYCCSATKEDCIAVSRQIGVALVP